MGRDLVVVVPLDHHADSPVPAYCSSSTQPYSTGGSATDLALPVTVS
jgi:hypothetical protein